MAYSKSKVTNPGRGKSLSGFEYCNQVSSTPGEAPAASDLQPGEIALNSADGKLHYKSQDGSVKSIPGGYSGTISIFDNGLGSSHLLTFTNGILTAYEIS
jgi:hypothetical protein